MRIKVNTQNLDQIQRELEAGIRCKIEKRPNGYLLFCDMLSHRGTMLCYSAGPFPRRIQVVKTALRQFGRELQAIRRLLPAITITDSSISTTQRYCEVYVHGVKVSNFDNSLRQYGKLDVSKPNPWEEFTPEEARLVGASIVLRYYRTHLPEGDWIDPIEVSLDRIHPKSRQPA